MPAKPGKTTDSFRSALPALVGERQISYRELARMTGFDQSYIARALGAKGERGPSLRLLVAVSKALDLPVDYFAEYREQMAIEAIKSDPLLRDKVYSQARRSAGLR